MSVYSKMPDAFDGNDYSNTAPAPERIYLQWTGDSFSEDNTWAEHTINDEDIPYIRADKITEYLKTK